MPRSASPFAMLAMNGCVMPAPAPCAITQQACASGGTRSNPETRCALLTTIVTGCAGTAFIDRACSEGGKRLEPSVNEPLPVEGHFLQIHHVGEPRVLHHLRV